MQLTLADLGGERFQPGFVAVGEREVASTLAELQRQRAADAAGGSGDGGGAADRSHGGSSMGMTQGNARLREMQMDFAQFPNLEPNPPVPRGLNHTGF